MNGSPKSQAKRAVQAAEPLVGTAVVSIPLPTRSDLSDWVDLMEVVEALCRRWPAQRPVKEGTFKL